MPTDEGLCALRIAGRLTAVSLVCFEQASTTYFGATATVVLERGVCLGAGILSHTRVERDQLLLALRSLHLIES